MSGANRETFLVREERHLERPRRRDAVLFQHLHHLETGEDTQVAVEAATGADRVDVRAGHHGCQVRIASGAGRDHVADGIDLDLHAQITHPADHEVTPGAVLVGQGEAGVAPFAMWPVDAADLTERVDPRGDGRCRYAGRAGPDRPWSADREFESGDLGECLTEGVDGTVEQCGPVFGRAAVGSPMWPSGPKSFDSHPKPTAPPNRT